LSAAAQPIRYISVAQISAARAAALAERKRLVDVLQDHLDLKGDVFVNALGATLHLPVMQLEMLNAATPLFDLLPLGECAQRNCVLLRREDASMVLATDDPFDGDLQSWAGERMPQGHKWALVQRRDLATFLAEREKALYALSAVRPATRPVADEREHQEDLSLKSISDETSEVVRMVRSTLRDALTSGTSDIHLETVSGGLVIRFRIDGILSVVKTIADIDQAEQAIARIKVLSELDVTERRVPQDGRFNTLDHGRIVDFRVSVMPSIHGEDVVLRVLDKQSLNTKTPQQLSLDSLGLTAPDMRTLRLLSRAPYGMVLVTGPTGSGKTTTLYAAITEVDNGDAKIITIEDPVEYQLHGVLQIPVNEKKGLTFARGLRSILRHDPDTIMIGEIRDSETADIAVQSALTGHLVFTTVHANNVFDVIGRFLHMGVDLYSFVSALNVIVAQRLVRLVCPHCATDYEPDAALLQQSALSPADTLAYRFRIGLGCHECRGSGYKGRTAIAELLVLDDELRELITAQAPVRQLKEAAQRSGTRLLRDAALETVKDGRTTLGEVNRVTFVA